MNSMYTIVTEGAPTVANEIVIDGFLSADDNEVLYKRWKSDWPTPVEYPGGVLGITCEHVLQVPQTKLNRVYGKVRGQRFRQIAEVHTNA